MLPKRKGARTKKRGEILNSGNEKNILLLIVQIFVGFLWIVTRVTDVFFIL